VRTSSGVASSGGDGKVVFFGAVEGLGDGDAMPGLGATMSIPRLMLGFLGCHRAIRNQIPFNIKAESVLYNGIAVLLCVNKFKLSSMAQVR